MAAAKTKETTPVVPDFLDVDADAVQAAQAALSGGTSAPLTPPASAEAKMDAKGVVKYTRWAESINITNAYRTVTKKGLLDVTIGAKVRQSKDNNGARAWFHFYLNTSGDVPDNHIRMNEQSIGALSTLLTATGYMPVSGGLKATLLNKMFPQKNQPGASSPIIGKTVIVNLVQQEGPKKDEKGQIVKDKKGVVQIDKRDGADSFLPDTGDDDE